MNKFKFREKPTKPKRQTDRRRIQIREGSNLETLLGQVPDDIEYANIKVEVKHVWDYDSNEYYLAYDEVQTDESFNVDLQIYKEKVAVYNAWRQENKEAVEIHFREKEKAAKLRRAKEVERLARTIKATEKKLEKLKKSKKEALSNESKK